jgi:transposase-like protein
MLCPRCEQGEIAAMAIRRSGAGLFVCVECEATWFVESEIGTKPFVDLGTHLRSLGLAPIWDELDARAP